MFYSQFLLTKQGPLGTIWLAAHGNANKLRKTQVVDTDLAESCGAPASSLPPALLRR
jgi:hypothetical protein